VSGGGVIQGGTEFVVAAYVITALVFGALTVSVVVRWRKAAAARRGPGPGGPAA
jgi:hypothetical protein